MARQMSESGISNSWLTAWAAAMRELPRQIVTSRRFSGSMRACPLLARDEGLYCQALPFEAVTFRTSHVNSGRSMGVVGTWPEWLNRT